MIKNKLLLISLAYLSINCFSVDSITESESSTPNTNNNSYNTNPNDPFEHYNRNAFQMNMKIDYLVVRPTTIWYINNVPDPVQTSASDFFNNLRDYVTLGNNILQLNTQQSMSALMRVSINSIFGIFGIIDVASSLGLTINKNNFGRTMKIYGWKNSSYFVIPLLGPSTIRDALGTIPDIYFNPTWYVVQNDYITVGLFVINAIDTRTKFLDTDKLLYISLDPYITMRDFYLASRGESSLINNNPNDISIDSILDENTTTPQKY